MTLRGLFILFLKHQLYIYFFNLLDFVLLMHEIRLFGFFSFSFECISTFSFFLNLFHLGFRIV